jgi:hypothetical protein
MLLEEKGAAQNKILGNLPDYPSYLSALAKFQTANTILIKFEEIIQKHVRSQDEF